ncbi:hypothetical protein OVA24_08070 [Luteolibacter sp. SL250]|uniref:hypothetical protein n=1 Tax=Luteolibacter sp. SL250 TaxID=2995170 RepID=UPI00226ECFC5|nr:hypothetical protein [Luteolibacter sp. SL250]WAC21340.1 hypothetical protein OVA24_08070 [Luteolibacter sp. SL250]
MRGPFMLAGMTWQEQLVAELRAVDREQATHGLYGLREAMKKGNRLPFLATLLFEKPPETNLLQRLGMEGRGSSYSETASFTLTDGMRADLEILTHASTKVRHYGDSYVLDRAHGKKSAIHPDLESIVPKLAAGRGYSAKRMNALLFITHAPTERQLKAGLGRAITPEFMDRYQVSLVFDIWEDIYRRGFHSGIFLWTAESSR